MHEIIAAQRRAAGNIWLIVSRLAGPATFGGAKKVKDIVDELPWSKEHPSEVLWVRYFRKLWMAGVGGASQG